MIYEGKDFVLTCYRLNAFHNCSKLLEAEHGRYSPSASRLLYDSTIFTTYSQEVRNITEQLCPPT